MGECSLLLALKLSHDGGFCLFEGRKLALSYEIEKLRNKPRHSPFDITIDDMRGYLSQHGCALDDVDVVVVDGWFEDPFRAALGPLKVPFRLAHYGNFFRVGEGLLDESVFFSEHLNRRYKSYTHISGHVYGAYCSSPAARRGEPALVLIWDGGTYPQLFLCDSFGTVQRAGYLFPISGFMYTAFAVNFEPYLGMRRDDLSLAGKYMAYVAKGETDEELLGALTRNYEELVSGHGRITNYAAMSLFEQRLLERFVGVSKASEAADEDVLATFHSFLENVLVAALRERAQKHSEFSKNLCYSGGCALNIKWNGAIRRGCDLDELWIPPFPNDAGNAIGAACCELVKSYGCTSIDWNVYSGPPLAAPPDAPAGWRPSVLPVAGLARLLHETQEPVVVLAGRAELGPRALGNRSILAAPVRAEIKGELNRIKKREDYRPVAPICLEEEAAKYFRPGTPDPFMLFDHAVLPEARRVIPAVCHLDGTARLQTVNRSQNPFMHELLSEYWKLSGVPVLCNTSANDNGSGFFPDVTSAIKWGRADYVWSDGVIYVNERQRAWLSAGNRSRLTA